MRTVTFSGLLLLATVISAVRKLPDDIRNEILSQKDDVQLIIDYLLNGAGKHQSYNRMANMADAYGGRLAGSEALEQAINHTIEEMDKEGLDNVHREAFQVPNWVRGEDNAAMLEPRVASLDIMALGSSVSTPAGGITADAIVVRSFDELDSRKQEVPGKIVIYNQEWVSYGASNVYRTTGAAQAARYGGVASMVRSVTQFSLYTPHTGSQYYDPAYTKVPTVSITVEDAEMLQRFSDKGQKIRVHLEVTSDTFGIATTHNAVGEIRGALHPEQTVTFGGHIDSWDVGTGVMDDGSGVVISWQALTTIKALGLSPKRTMRAVYWSAEEIGVYGGQAYYDAHKADSANMALVMESDGGVFAPSGVGFSGSGLARAIIEEIVEEYLAPHGSTTVYPSGGGADIGNFMNDGVPGLSLASQSDKYFWYHHTRADGVAMQDPDDLDLGSVVWTVVAYVVANLQDILPREGEYPDVPEPATAIDSGAVPLLAYYGTAITCLGISASRLSPTYW